jgi:hypothetical protein
MKMIINSSALRYAASNVDFFIQDETHPEVHIWTSHGYLYLLGRDPYCSIKQRIYVGTGIPDANIGTILLEDIANIKDFAAKIKDLKTSPGSVAIEVSEHELILTDHSSGEVLEVPVTDFDAAIVSIATKLFDADEILDGSISGQFMISPERMTRFSRLNPGKSFKNVAMSIVMCMHPLKEGRVLAIKYGPDIEIIIAGINPVVHIKYIQQTLDLEDEPEIEWKRNNE